MCIIRILYGKKCFALQVEFQTIADAGSRMYLYNGRNGLKGDAGIKLKAERLWRDR
jgi:hypothetical protein